MERDQLDDVVRGVLAAVTDRRGVLGCGYTALGRAAGIPFGVLAQIMDGKRRASLGNVQKLGGTMLGWSILLRRCATALLAASGQPVPRGLHEPGNEERIERLRHQGERIRQERQERRLDKLMAEGERLATEVSAQVRAGATITAS